MCESGIPALMRILRCTSWHTHRAWLKPIGNTRRRGYSRA
eukprot:CAMPEP_0204155352 /NCGR_PEP_ID=MMETSP0361-20130328/29522_1 /ASSEMBLY_ACC=CAM_ASM_000343 /TAXON_ID=268821 /ORGANISM="Scrippsiella Hangoei, Strain SHTV-5" /LENGTH=39 /DNA_ID= /DNA_START= /DNA_END= /DNA_ORIENTATION=